MQDLVVATQLRPIKQNGFRSRTPRANGQMAFRHRQRRIAWTSGSGARSKCGGGADRDELGRTAVASGKLWCAKLLSTMQLTFLSPIKRRCVASDLSINWLLCRCCVLYTPCRRGHCGGGYAGFHFIRLPGAVRRRAGVVVEAPSRRHGNAFSPASHGGVERRPADIEHWDRRGAAMRRRDVCGASAALTAALRMTALICRFDGTWGVRDAKVFPSGGAALSRQAAVLHETGRRAFSLR